MKSRSTNVGVAAAIQCFVRLVVCCCFPVLLSPVHASAQQASPAQAEVVEDESRMPQPSAAARKQKSQPRVLVTFSAMGDVPREQSEEGQLVRQLAGLPSDVEFLVHLGDIKSGRTACNERAYLKVAGLLATSRVPVLIVPGDNEWNDCPQPDRAWRLWKKYFARFERHW